MMGLNFIIQDVWGNPLHDMFMSTQRNGCPLNLIHLPIKTKHISMQIIENSTVYDAIIVGSGAG
ncbi:hypothetical protein VM932_16485, partial [Muricauda sp. SYSU M86414]|nr:hypothetical protein [Muricauda sp. SYSU M86414]